MPASTLSLTLNGVLSWSRPRPGRNGVRYEGAYAAGRDGWALLARQAVLEAGWAPPPGSRYAVEVLIHGGGKRDLDRVVTACCDALEAGGAIDSDAAVDALHATRRFLVRGQTNRDASTTVRVTVLSPGCPPAGKASK